MQYLLVMTLTFFSCSKSPSTESIADVQTTATSKIIPLNVKSDTAIFAGGCFWCMEGPFEKVDGVFDAVSGYTGGHQVNPKYEEVGSGTTGHREAVQIIFDPAKITYAQLVEIFWMQINPTDDGGQFADRGFQYTTAVFYRNDLQRTIAEASKEKLKQSGKFNQPIVTPLIPAGVFYAAEDYHQDFYKKNPGHYNRYRVGSGRAGYLEKLWGAH